MTILNQQESSCYFIGNVFVWSAFSEPTRMDLVIKSGHLADISPQLIPNTSLVIDSVDVLIKANEEVLESEKIHQISVCW